MYDSYLFRIHLEFGWVGHNCFSFSLRFLVACQSTKRFPCPAFFLACWCPTWPRWGQFPMPEKSMMKRVAMAEVGIIFGSLCLGVFATQSLGMSQHVSTIVIRWVWTSTALMVRQKIAPARSGTATMMRFQLGWRGRLDGFKDHRRILGTIKNCP